MQVSRAPLHSFSTSSISTSMNTVSVKKTSVVEIQITLQNGHRLVNHNEIHENLQAFLSLDKPGFEEPGFGWMHCK